jgi:hypothetical protein
MAIKDYSLTICFGMEHRQSNIVKSTSASFQNGATECLWFMGHMSSYTMYSEIQQERRNQIM